METVIIDIPEKKSILVKQILKELGVIIRPTSKTPPSDYKQKIAKIPVWSNEDLKPIEDARKAFDSFKPQEW